MSRGLSLVVLGAACAMVRAVASGLAIDSRGRVMDVHDISTIHSQEWNGDAQMDLSPKKIPFAFVLASSNESSYTVDHDIAKAQFIIRRKPFAQHPQHAFFRVRLVGPEVLIAKVTANSPGEYVATYDIRTPGNYVVNIARYYEKIDMGKLKDQCLDLLQLNLDSNIQYLRPTKPKPSSTSICNPSNFGVPGRWLFSKGNPMDFEITWAAHAAMPVNPQPYEELYYQHDCAMIGGSPPDFHLMQAQCEDHSKNYHVCMFGDSQLRELHNEMGRLLFPGQCQNLAVKEICQINTANTALAAWKFSYFSDQWMDQVFSQLSGCTHVVVNMMQWPISQWAYLKPNGGAPAPWPLEMYTGYLDEKIGLLKEQFVKGHGGVLIWATGYSIAMDMWSLGQCPQTDWRTDAIVNQFNDAANALMVKHGIPIIDFANIQQPLEDISYDAHHYHSPISNALSQATMHMLCNSRRMAEQLRINFPALNTPKPGEEKKEEGKDEGKGQKDITPSEPQEEKSAEDTYGKMNRNNVSETDDNVIP